MKSPINFEEIYESYIDSENEVNRQERYKGKESFYRASSSGFCSRKIYFESVEQIEPTNPVEPKGKRIMRLGTVVHEDLQNALVYYNNINNKELLNKEKIIKNKQKERFHIEKNIEIKELNVRGHYDCVFEGDNVYLFDFKTIASWSYSKKFGRNKDFDPSIHQELQLGTYGHAIKKEFGRLDGMFLCYYKKDDSRMKIIPVSLDYVDKAKRFWTNVNEEIKGGLPMFNLGVSPASSWNCRYCQFYDHCRPPSF